MYKKIVIICMIILVITLIGGGIWYFMYQDKEKKAQAIFGDEYCDAVIHMATKDLVVHHCKTCGVEFQDSSMREEICDNCAKEANRCNFCGRKLNEEVKKQREELLK